MASWPYYPVRLQERQGSALSSAHGCADTYDQLLSSALFSWVVGISECIWVGLSPWWKCSVKFEPQKFQRARQQAFIIPSLIGPAIQVLITLNSSMLARLFSRSLPQRHLLQSGRRITTMAAKTPRYVHW